MKDISIIEKNGKLDKVWKPTGEFIEPNRINKHLIFESVNIENQNRRQGTHKTKNKSEVSGTGKKPYKQKHTGRARQGSKRNPHYRGGGIAFGPTPERNYCIRINKKASKIAFISAFWEIIESGNIAVLSNEISSIKYKTKEFANFLKASNLLDKKLLLITDMEEKALSKSAENIENLILRSPMNCSVRDLLNQNYLLITNKAIEAIYKRMETWK